MRILILGLNYSPELVGIGRFTGDMALYLARQGHDLGVVTAPPYYPSWKIAQGYSGWLYRSETVQRVDVIRCPLWVPKHPSNLKRLLHLFSFALSSFPAILLQALRYKPDIVLCVIPTLFSAPFALLAARLVNAKAWLHIQDFELDAAFNLNMLPARKLIYPLSQWCERLILTHFDHISTISENMRKLCIQKGVRPERTFLLTNWVDTQSIYPLNASNSLRHELNIPEHQIVILYHGSMGRKQGLEILLDCATYLQDDSNIIFILCGEGVARRDLEKRAYGMSNVRMINLQPESRLNELVNLADIHILPQLAGAADLVMPSKLSSMLASGKPVIACAEPDTQLGQVVEFCGRIVAPENASQLTKAILELSQDSVLREEIGRKGRAYAKSHLDRRKILEQITINLLEWIG